MNLATLAVAIQVAWKRVKPFVLRDTVILPAIGFTGIILLWWAIASLLF